MEVVSVSLQLCTSHYLTTFAATFAVLKIYKIVNCKIFCLNTLYICVALKEATNIFLCSLNIFNSIIGRSRHSIV